MFNSLEEFQATIDAKVTESSKKYNDFYMFIKSNKGIHPIDLMNSVERLYKKQKIDKTKYDLIKKSARRKIPVTEVDMLDVLPIPHLLDYDWRFSEEGLLYLTQKLESEIQDGEATIVFMGTPSLFKYCDINLKEKIKLVLIDINAKQYENGINTKRAECTTINIEKEAQIFEKISADYIIMDPPWYYNYYMLFFNRAAMMSRKDTYIYCIMPPLFTRFTAQSERNVLLKEISWKYGFKKTHYYQGTVSYHTPPFEKNVLKEHGILSIPNNWRIGDLLIVQKITEKKHYPVETGIVCELNWVEETIQTVRFKLRYCCSNQDITSYDISLNKVYSSEIYPSVKRSFSDKENINVWTSGNRVFWCSNIPILRFIIVHINDNLYDEILKSNTCLPNQAQFKNMESVKRQIWEIVETEVEEYGPGWKI